MLGFVVMAKYFSDWLPFGNRITDLDLEFDSDGVVDFVPDMFTTAAHFDNGQSQTVGFNPVGLLLFMNP